MRVRHWKKNSNLKFEIENKASEKKSQQQQQHQRPTDKQEKQIRQWNLWSCELELACLLVCAISLCLITYIRHITLAHVGFKSVPHLKIHCESKRRRRRRKKRYISFNCYFKHRQNLRSCFLLLLEMIFLDTKRTAKNWACVFVYANKSANKLKCARTHTERSKKLKWNDSTWFAFHSTIQLFALYCSLN